MNSASTIPIASATKSAQKTNSLINDLGALSAFLRIPTKHKKLCVVKNLPYGKIEIYEETANDPSYTIPLVILEEGYITFTKCRECGNLAIYSDNPNAEIKMVQCIEKPPYHRYILE